jgi:hypothetical protein
MSAQIRDRTPRAVDITPSEDDQPLTGVIGYAIARRTAYGNEAETLEEIRVPIFHTAPARVRVSGSVTQNLGDYNSARVEVSVEMPCLPEATEVQRVYHMLSAQVDEMCRRELAVATGQQVS